MDPRDSAKSPEVDVAVVGGGPAGTATAIQCAQAGLRVTLLDRCAFPRAAVGETLHPGVLPLLRTLGVEQQVLDAGFLRHEGHYVQWDGPPRFVPFGSDADAPWRGLQAWRPTFDALLLDRACQLGVQVLQPCRVLRANVESDRIASVKTCDGLVGARFIVDATGRRRWLAHQLGLPSIGPRHRLLAWYGYVEGNCPLRDATPLIAADSGGWTWTARVRPHIYQWTRLPFNGARPDADWLPAELGELRPLGPVCGADVSWRAVTEPAGPGYFLTGDAAAILDPASSHGVMRALMSGMMAGHLITQVLKNCAVEADAVAEYTRWLREWFFADVGELMKLYASLPQPPAWAFQIPGRGFKHNPVHWRL